MYFLVPLVRCSSSCDSCSCGLQGILLACVFQTASTCVDVVSSCHETTFMPNIFFLSARLNPCRFPDWLSPEHPFEAPPEAGRFTGLGGDQKPPGGGAEGAYVAFWGAWGERFFVFFFFV